MFHRNSIAAAAFFLAAKVRKQPMTHRSFIAFCFVCLGRRAASQAGACYQNPQHLPRENGHNSRGVHGAGTGARTQREHSPTDAGL